MMNHDADIQMIGRELTVYQRKNTMSTAKHTPGPWANRGTHIHYQKNPGGYRFDIAEVFRDVGAQSADANARLIAAAPALLEACKAANDWLKAFREKVQGDDKFDKRVRDLLCDTQPFDNQGNPTLTMLSRAIAQAEGEL